MNLVFEEVEEILKQYRMRVDAAEFHGVLSGLICVGVKDDEIEDWLPLLCGNNYLTESEYRPLEHNVRGAYLDLRSELDSDGFEFNVLLPDERHSLERRIVSMSSWCKGYLTAICEYGEIYVDHLPEDCAEFLDDVEQISELQIDDDESIDELDTAFLAIEEHLRIGVQLVYEHLNVFQSSDHEEMENHLS